MFSTIKDNLRKAENGFSNSSKVYDISPILFGMRRRYEFLVRKYCYGRVLDLGAGRLYNKRLLFNHSNSYVSIDRYPVNPEIDLLGDVQHLPFRSDSFDTIFCTAVLQYIKEPSLALKEIARVLKPNSFVILSAPHLSYLNNEPHDMYRFTKYGIAYLFEKVGLSVIFLEPVGGLFSFLGSILSLFFLGLTYKFKPLFGMFIFLAKYSSRLVFWIDTLWDKKKIFAQNYIVVGQKKR